MAKKQHKLTLVLAILMLSRFVMKRIHPSVLIRARELVSDAQLHKAKLSREDFDDLPREAFHGNGRPMEPMNLVLIGSEEQVLHSFLEAGWHEADPVSMRNVMHAWSVIIFGRQYLTGPVTPLFVDDRKELMAFQKPTKINKFKQRHHGRIWSTQFQDTDGRPVWIMHASYDINIKGSGALNFPPTHKIAPEIDKERDLLVADLREAGAKLRATLQFQNAFEGFNAFGDEFNTDGKIAIVEMPNVT